MVKTITDLLVTIFGIALAAFLVKNAAGTSTIVKTGTGGLRDVIRAVTFQ